MSTPTAKPTFAEKREAAKAAVEKMQSILVEQVASGADWTEYLRFINRFRGYSINNTIWLWAQWHQRQHAIRVGRALETMFFGGPITPELPDIGSCAGFSTWSGMGGSVRKGEKALSVLAPMIVTDKDVIDPVTHKPAKKCIGFILKNRTFCIHQVDGIDLPPEPVTLLTGEGDEGVWDSLVALAAHEGFTVEVRSTGSDANGFCSPATKEIVVAAKIERAQQIKTLTHEVAHMLLHGDATPLGMPRAVKEIEAESVAYAVAQMLGVDTSSYSFGYVGSWSKGDGALIASTLGRVSDTAARIVGWIESGELASGKPGSYKFAEEVGLAA